MIGGAGKQGKPLLAALCVRDQEQAAVPQDGQKREKQGNLTLARLAETLPLKEAASVACGVAEGRSATGDGAQIPPWRALQGAERQARGAIHR